MRAGGLGEVLLCGGCDLDTANEADEIEALMIASGLGCVNWPFSLTNPVEGKSVSVEEGCRLLKEASCEQ